MTASEKKFHAMNDPKTELVAIMLDLYKTKPVLYWLLAATIEATKPVCKTVLAGKSKGQYKRIIRAGRRIQSGVDPGTQAMIEAAITYIRQNMGEWRA